VDDLGAARYPAVQAEDIQAGTGTTLLRLYHDRLEGKGIKALSPTDPDQENVAAVIRSTKAGDERPAAQVRIKAEAEKLVIGGRR
jgi:aspartate/glutamate racemase